MNLVLFDSADATMALPVNDPRARHITGVLRVGTGQRFDVGAVNGPRGKGWIVQQEKDALCLAFAWGETPPTLPPITLLVGMPRPQTARKLLQETTSLGVSHLAFFQSIKGEPSYSQSTLWSSTEWQDLLKAGAAQAFHTGVPRVTHHESLGNCLKQYPATPYAIALDVYEGTERLSSALDGCLAKAPPPTHQQPVLLAIGSERGWDAREREQFRTAGWTLAHLGERVLRTETAAITALALTHSKLGYL
ncbi:MAG: RsmE family RNA methyltransferase [Verrucomicrobiota bacterium]|nr:RsmE family RNA methyltransferase [Verrucomicrobiota bacterium]